MKTAGKLRIYAHLATIYNKKCLGITFSLQKENVKTLSAEIFAKIDKLASPRLVDDWEQDPCSVPQWRGADKRAIPMDEMGFGAKSAEGDSKPQMFKLDMGRAPPVKSPKLGVKIEAQFTVGEYPSTICSHERSSEPRQALGQTSRLCVASLEIDGLIEARKHRFEGQ